MILLFLFFNIVNAYFDFFPLLVNNSWTTDCYSMSSHYDGQKLTLHKEKIHNYLCIETYVVYSKSMHILTVSDVENPSVVIDSDYKIGLMRGKLEDFMDTAELFVPEISTHTPDYFLKKNLDFMNSIGVRMEFINPVDAPIYSGDVITIMRLDGLDPMLSWAMGSASGHMAVAISNSSGIYILESTTKDGYWDTNGIQATEVNLWKQKAIKAQYNAVVMRLNVPFNEESAWKLFYELEGTDYGYSNLLTGWLDNPSNLPCTKNSCITFNHLQLIMLLMDKIQHLSPEIARIYMDPINVRLGTNYKLFSDVPLTTKEVEQVFFIPELDSYLYNGKRSMVCNVLVCNILRAGGVFGKANFNCGETTNYDIYKLNIFSSYVQILGNYKLTLNDFATKNIENNFANNCGGHYPDFIRNC